MQHLDAKGSPPPSLKWQGNRATHRPTSCAPRAPTCVEPIYGGNNCWQNSFWYSGWKLLKQWKSWFHILENTCHPFCALFPSLQAANNSQLAWEQLQKLQQQSPGYKKTFSVYTIPHPSALRETSTFFLEMVERLMSLLQARDVQLIWLWPKHEVQMWTNAHTQPKCVHQLSTKQAVTQSRLPLWKMTTICSPPEPNKSREGWVGVSQRMLVRFLSPKWQVTSNQIQKLRKQISDESKPFHQVFTHVFT